jgi:hypothetical protein
VQALSTKFFIEMKSDFAVRSGAQPVAGTFKFPLNGLVAVEFPINHDPGFFVFARDRLISGRQVDNAKPRVAQTNSTVRRDPMPLPIRAAVIEASRGPFHYCFRDWITTREERNNSAHS